MLLPVHPQPFQDELLSSWLVRLSVSNGWHLHTFCSTVLGCQVPVWNRDIDKFYQPELLRCLQKATGKSTTQINRLSLQDFNGILFSGSTDAAFLPWILPLGIYHRTHRRGGLQICPDCLREQKTPYFKKEWRLGFVTICMKHKVQLLDKCPSCKSPIVFHRLGIGSKTEKLPESNLCLCSSCRLDLRYVRPQSIRNIDQDLLLPYENFLYNFSKSTWSIDNENFSHPLSFYDGVRVVVKTILHSYSLKFRQNFKEKWGHSVNISIDQRLAFEFYPVESRFIIMLMACWLLDKWPTNFETMTIEKMISRTSFSYSVDTIPYWIQRQLDYYLPDKRYIPSKVELESVFAYIRKHKKEIDTRSISEVMGVSRDSAYFYLSKLSTRYGIK